MGYRLPGDEAQVALVRRQLDAVGRMDLDLLECLLGERSAARSAEPERPPRAECSGEAAIAAGGAAVEELRTLEQQLVDQLDERIRACARALYQLTGSRRVAAESGGVRGS